MSGPGPAFQPAPSPQPVYAAATPPAGDYASWGDRAIGYIIDQVIVSAVMLLIFLVFGSFLAATTGMGAGRPDAAGGVCCMMLTLFVIASLVVGVYNRVYLVAQRGYSIGQGVMKLKTVDANGRLLTQGSAFIRLLAQVAISFIPFGSAVDLLWPLWDPCRQTLHDKAVGSYVIRNPNVI
jgi:uncharacterized RDD family membrane protein YckC